MDGDDFFKRTVVWATVSFIILQALLPTGWNNIAYLFLTLQSTIIYVLGIARAPGIDVTATTARLLITYIALAALIVKEEEEQ